MAKDPKAEEIDVGDPDATPKGKPKPDKKKLIVIGAAAAVVVLGGGGAAALMMGGKHAAEPGHEAKADAAPAKHGGDAEGGGDGGGAINLPVDVPPLLVNLRSPDGAPHFLKVHVMLVPGPKSNAEELKKDVPPLLDAYQPFLRELRPEDLAGSAAVFRIKEELLLRARDTLGEGHVKEVLVQDLIQQ